MTFSFGSIGHFAALEILIKHGGDVNTSNREGFTPLMVACLNCNLEKSRVIKLKRRLQHCIRSC